MPVPDRANAMRRRSDFRPRDQERVIVSTAFDLLFSWRWRDSPMPPSTRTLPRRRRITEEAAMLSGRVKWFDAVRGSRISVEAAREFRFFPQGILRGEPRKRHARQ
jgi:hypothetical protein